MTFRTDWDTESNPAYDVWTSVNGSEIVPGILSPLMATTFNRFDTIGLRELMATYPGGELVQLFDPPIGNFFGVVAGRLCLNNGFSVAATSALDADIAQAILQQFFTGARGGERFLVAVDDERRAAAYAVATRQRADAPAVLDRVGAQLYAERASDRSARDLELPFAEALDRFKELSRLNSCELLNLHYVVSVAAGEWQVRLAMVLAGNGIDPAAVVGLCSGLGEVESAKPAIGLFELARLAAELPEVEAALRDGELDTLSERMAAADPDDGPEGSRFGARFGHFLFEYGYRVQGEADPTNADWSEIPTFALSQVRAMLDVDADQAPQATIARAVAGREALEAAVRAQLPSDVAPTFDEVLANAQHFTRLRERSKATWVLGARRARAPYLAVCRRLVEAGLAADPDDARYLTLPELESVANGRGPDAEAIAALVARRRAQADEAATWALPDNWVGEPELQRRGGQAATDVLQGLGVSIGDGPVTGTARIITSAEAGLARDIDVGDILVTPFTDAPWTPLFIPAGAVVTETGGVLSHAATVAREFGIPAVVMCKGATELIADGDTVTVDGAAGTVTVINRVGSSVAAR
ncbi:MAG: PEP-utilizing enzyme [Acidimicrobiales bacterium]